MFSILIFSPFFILFAIGIPYLDPSIWLIGPPHGLLSARMGTAMAVILWQMSGWDAVVSCVEEVHEPRRTIPRAFVFAMILMIANYSLPVMIGVCILGPSEIPNWDTGTFAKVISCLIVIRSRWA